VKSTSHVFDEAASRRGRVPRFILDFTDLGIELISWRDPDNPDRWDLIEKVPSWTGSVRPNEGRADVSGVTVTVIGDERFHQLLPLIKKEEHVQLLGGFEGIPETDFTSLITGLVEDCEESDHGLWKIKINDLRYYKIAQVMRSFGATHLDGAIAAGDAIIAVDSTDGSIIGDKGFHDPAGAGDGLTYALLIDDEILVPTGYTANSFTGCARGQYGVAGGSAASTHDDGAQVRELIIIEDNPVNLFLKLMCSTGAGTNGDYDVWESDQGLGVDQSLIDIEKYERERNRFIPTDTLRFVLKEPIDDFKSWSEGQIFRVMNAYPVVSGDGAISLVLYHMPFAEDPDEFTESHFTRFSGWSRGLKEVVNNAHVKYDKSVIDGEYKLQRFDLEASSINRHGLSKAWKLESDGLYSDLQAEAIVERLITRMFLRYADGPVSFRARIDFGLFRWDPGDIVSVTLDFLTDIARGARGVAADLMEIVRVRPDPDRGEIDIEVLDSRLEGKGGMIAPNGWPTYADADEEERKWAYICNTATELMPNGDPPTLII